MPKTHILSHMGRVRLVSMACCSLFGTVGPGASAAPQAPQAPVLAISQQPAANTAQIANTAAPAARRPAGPGTPVNAPAVPPAGPRMEIVQGSPCAKVDIAPLVQIQVGKSTLIRPASPVSRILLGNPSGSQAGAPVEAGAVGGAVAAAGAAAGAGAGAAAVGGGGAGGAGVSTRPGVAEVDVVLLGSSEVYLLGKTIGSTNVVMIDRARNCTAFDVVVGMDVTGLQAVIGQLLPNETGVKVSAAFDSIVLTGSVSDAEALTRITDLANAYVRGGAGGGGQTGVSAARNTRIINMLGVGAPQQVMLEVKVAEISKNLLDQFGIDFSRAFALGDSSAIRFLSGIIGGKAAVIGQIAGTGPSGVPLSSVGTVIGATVPGLNGTTGGNVTVTYDGNGTPTYTTSYGTVPGRSATGVNLNMQKTDGLVKVLAEPSVMAISGQTGSFLAGGKIFIPVSSNTDTGGRTVTLEEREFGVSVKFTPTVLGGGRINLQVRPEVSELNPGGVTISGVGGTSVLPSFTSRKAETTVQLMDGQSFAIGGLIKNNTTTNITAFPFLGELPILGALFRSTSFQTEKSELVFVITPRLVKPLQADFKLPTEGYVPPTRKELIWEGRLEGRREEGAAPAAANATPAAPQAAPEGGGFDTGKTAKP